MIDLCPSTSSVCAVMGTSIAIDGGSVEFTGLTPGSEAVYQFTCQEGFGLEGDTTRTCLEDLKWSGETPQCLEIPSMFKCFLIESITMQNYDTDYFATYF